MEFLARFVVWCLAAFWLWLGFGLLFSGLRIPRASILAAVVGWIGAGLLAIWILPPVA
jgi:hypothetical protein